MGRRTGASSTRSRANSPRRGWRGHRDVHRTRTETASSVLHGPSLRARTWIPLGTAASRPGLDTPVGEAQLQPVPWALESPAGLHEPFQQLPRVKGPCIPVSAWAPVTQEQGGAKGVADRHIPAVPSGIAPSTASVPPSPKPVKLLRERSDQTPACRATPLFLMLQASAEAAWRALLFSIHNPKQRAPGASSQSPAQPLNCLEMVWGEATQFW